MFLGNDIVTVKTESDEIAVSGCSVTPGGRALIPYPLEGQQVLVILEDGRRFIARDVVTWSDASGEFDHAEGRLEEVGDGGSPD